MRTRVFTVSEETWLEHRKAGIAAINDPTATEDTPHSHATRQRVMTEISGIRPGDRLFFYMQRTKEILGRYEATSSPFFDTDPLYSDAQYINYRFPFRVGFKPVIEYPRPLHVNEIWAGRDAGKFWTMQQARGDVVGRHACWPLTLREGDLLEQMFQEVNIIIPTPMLINNLPENREPLPYDYRSTGVRVSHLNYEATLQALLLEGLADGKWRDIFGDYDDFSPFVSTSEGREIDTILFHHDTQREVLWYQLIELKSDRFRQDDLLQILAYETWLTSSGQVGGNPRSVHMVAIAARFDDEVISHITARENLKQKPIKLLKYKFDQMNNQLSFVETR